jgi:uncharacterized protein YbaP (TraB family)
MRLLERLRDAFSNERTLRMIWRVERNGKASFLAGAAHFFPYRFRRSLLGYVGGARRLVLEGPLDEGAMRKVIEAGAADGPASLYDCLDAAALRRIRQALPAQSPLSASQLYWEALQGVPQEGMRAELRGLKPWMAFFYLWGQFRQRHGWTCTMERDALDIAAETGIAVHYLETIEEQIETLNRIPLQRIVAFLKHVDWDRYRRDYVRHYLDGDLPALAAAAAAFPTYCEPVIERRNPALHARMRPHLEHGGALVIVGVTHCEGIIALLRAQGYRTTQAR